MSAKLSLAIVCLAGFLMATVAYGQYGNQNYRDVHHGDDRMLEVLNDAIYQYNGREHQGRTHHMRLGNIRRARGHEYGDGGMRYNVEFDFNHTNCRRGNSYISREEFDRCEFDRSRRSHRCRTTVHYEPRNRGQTVSINEFNCDDQYWK